MWVLVFWQGVVWLNFHQGNPLMGPVLTSRPYRNVRIIAVIRQLYFEGGADSFVNHFNGYVHLLYDFGLLMEWVCSQFPRYEGEDGVTVVEVPVPMVALVATAVSVLISFEWCHSDMYQLYAAMDEWHTGVHQSLDFSTDRYMDIYQGHIDSLNYIHERRSGAFHLMMGSIYAEAKWVVFIKALLVAITNTCYSSSAAVSTQGAPVEIDLDALEGWWLMVTLFTRFLVIHYTLMWDGIGMMPCLDISPH